MEFNGAPFPELLRPQLLEPPRPLLFHLLPSTASHTASLGAVAVPRTYFHHNLWFPNPFCAYIVGLQWSIQFSSVLSTTVMCIPTIATVFGHLLQSWYQVPDLLSQLISKLGTFILQYRMIFKCQSSLNCYWFWVVMITPHYTSKSWC